MASKKQRKRKHKARRRASRNTRDRDVMFTDSLATAGGFVRTSSHTAVDEGAGGSAGFPPVKSEVVARTVAKRERLLEIIRLVGPVDLVAGAWFMFLRMDPNTHIGSEEEPWAAYVQYLALQSLPDWPDVGSGVDPQDRLLLTREALDLTRGLFIDTVLLYWIDDFEGGHQDLGHFRLQERLESLAVRGSGYPEHINRVIHGCFSPLDDDCRRILGFTAADATLLSNGVVDLLNSRTASLSAKAQDLYQELLAELKRGRRTGSSEVIPESILRLAPKKAKAQLEVLVMQQILTDVGELAVFSAEQLAAQVGVDHETARAFLEAFSCDPASYSEQYHSFPVGAHLLTTKPVLRAENGYLVPVPHAVLETLRPGIEDLLRVDPVAWDRYTRLRGRFLETETVRLLATAIPGTEAWKGLAWASDQDNSDLDGLIDAGDIALRIQCKAGRITAPARRGAPRSTTEELEKLITDAAEQHARLATALESRAAEDLGLSPAQAAALSRPLQIEVIVTLDDVTTWSTHASELKVIHILPPDRNTPWILSLTDLMVVVDLLQGASLVDYIVRRQRLERCLERDGHIRTHDELDWVGNYIEKGLFFDSSFEGDEAVGGVFLLSHTDTIDAWYWSRAGVRTVSTPRPTQAIPRGLKRLIRRLETERPKHWLIACLALLSCNGRSRQSVSDWIERLGTRLATQGWSSFRGMFPHFGMTLYVDHTDNPGVVRKRARLRASASMSETQLTNWIVVGEGPNQKLFVITLSEDGIESLVSWFTDPPTQPPDGSPAVTPPIDSYTR